MRADFQLLSSWSCVYGNTGSTCMASWNCHKQMNITSNSTPINSISQEQKIGYSGRLFICVEFVDGVQLLAWLSLDSSNLPGYVAGREDVRLLLKILDPVGVKQRTSRKLRWRQYHSKGLNSTWHILPYRWI